MGRRRKVKIILTPEEQEAKNKENYKNVLNLFGFSLVENENDDETSESTTESTK